MHVGQDFLRFGNDFKVFDSVRTSRQIVVYTSEGLALMQFGATQIKYDIARLLVSDSQIVINSFLATASRTFNFPPCTVYIYIGRSL